MPHQNRNWQRRWSVDFESQTVTHVDGWVFKFTKNDEGGFDGKLIRQPENITRSQIMNAANIAKQAGDFWIKSRKGRQ